MLYGEGAVAHAAVLLRDGATYRDAAGPSFVAANYPPLYFALAAIGDPFVSGRLWSAGATLLVAVLVAWRARRAGPLVAACLALSFVAAFPVMVWGVAVKPDLVALGLTVAAVVALDARRAVAGGGFLRSPSAKPTVFSSRAPRLARGHRSGTSRAALGAAPVWRARWRSRWTDRGVDARRDVERAAVGRRPGSSRSRARSSSAPLAAAVLVARRAARPPPSRVRRPWCARRREGGRQLRPRPLRGDRAAPPPPRRDSAARCRSRSRHVRWRPPCSILRDALAVPRPARGRPGAPRWSAARVAGRFS